MPGGIFLSSVGFELSLAAKYRGFLIEERGHDELKKSRPWLADINEAKSDLRDQLEDVNTRLATDQARLNTLNLTLETLRARLDANDNQLKERKTWALELSGRVDEVARLLHQRVDNVVNASRDMSIAHEDHQQNLFEVRPELAACLRL